MKIEVVGDGPAGPVVNYTDLVNRFVLYDPILESGIVDTGIYKAYVEKGRVWSELCLRSDGTVSQEQIDQAHAEFDHASFELLLLKQQIFDRFLRGVTN